MQNKVAVVTGASRGIGAATAKLLAANGYAVVINYLQSAAAADKLVEAVIHRGGKALAVKADMQSEEDICQLFALVDKKLGPVTALVNNAGINGGLSRVADITLAKLETVFATNVYGTFLCSREAVKRMQANGGGVIVNVSSEAAKFGGNQLAHYAAAKAAINAFTIGFAREVAALNIRVNAVSPAVIATEIHQDMSVERLQALKQSLPMGRMGTAEEVAQTILWLVSEPSSYISGTIVSVSGAK